MKHVQRALGTIAVTAVVVAGPIAGITPSAQAQEPPRTESVTAESPAGLLDLLPIDLPLLSGLAGVGSLLNVTQPIWNLIGVTNSIVWLRDGVPIPGTEDLWSYLPTEADAGHDLSAMVTGSLLGLLPLSLITNALGIPLLGSEEPPTATTPVVTAGTAKVGTDLTATPPVWNATVDSTTYQWLRAGAPIPGATTTTYRVAPEDVAKVITVRATGTKGDVSGTSVSAPKLGVLGAAPATTTPPKLTGKPQVGSLLNVSPGTWSGTGAITFAYQWYRRTTPIPGATASSYVVKGADAARPLAVVVTATRPGYATGLAATNQVTVAKSASTTTLSLVKKKIGAKDKGLLRITLRGGATKPAGRVSVYDGARLLKVYSVRASDNGVRVVKLPRLAAGAHRITAAFAGDASRGPSTSKTVTLTVRSR
jgi:hypothetical protein